MALDIIEVSEKNALNEAINNKPGKIIGSNGGEIFNDYMNNTATGNSAHAEGMRNNASGNYSHAEGWYATASGQGSHAEGNATTASGLYSHAEGEGTIAAGKRQHVQGLYNIEDTANAYAHIVGNGEYGKPSNAHTLDWSGNAWFAGNITAANFNIGTNTLLHSGNYTNYLPYRIQLLTTAKDFETPGVAGNWSNEFVHGLSFRPAYNNNNAPTNYGNVLQIGQSGAGQLFLGWSGTDNYTERIWYRSHRDTTTGGWGQWKAIPFYTYSTSDLTAGSSALDTGTIHLVYE